MIRNLQPAETKTNSISFAYTSTGGKADIENLRTHPDDNAGLAGLIKHCDYTVSHLHSVISLKFWKALLSVRTVQFYLDFLTHFGLQMMELHQQEATTYLHLEKLWECLYHFCSDKYCRVLMALPVDETFSQNLKFWARCKTFYGLLTLLRIILHELKLYRLLCPWRAWWPD